MHGASVATASCQTGTAQRRETWQPPDAMKIVLLNHHVGGQSGGGGGVRLMLELGRGLAQRGHRVTVAVYDYLPGGEFDYATAGLEILAVRTGAVEWSLGRVALARSYWLDMPKVARLVTNDVDVINSHDWLGLRPGRIAANRLGAPFVWTRNDETPWERGVAPEDTIYGDPRLTRRAFHLVTSWSDLRDARRTDQIVVLSDPQTAIVRRSYGMGSVVVPMGPPPQFFDPPDRGEARERLGIAADAFQVVAFGMLVNHRRFEHLIEAMALLRDDPSIHALIGGSDHADPAYADHLEALIGELGLGDRVTLPRRTMSDQEMKDMYAAADVFAILNKRYAWGLAPLEALASGTPTLVCNGAQVAHVLAGRPGVAVEPMEDPAATAAAIRRWRTGEGRVGIEDTRRWLRDELSIDVYVTRMEAIYEAAIAARRS
jgi:glycosyltransferase involved in cell wall biosynthesis